MGCLQSKTEQQPLMSGTKKSANYSQSDNPKIKSEFEKFGQGHVFQFEKQLSEAENTELYKQLKDLHIDHCVDVFNRSMNSGKESSDGIEPFPQVDDESNTDKEILNRWNDAGLQAIARGELAFVLLAGGQGTRLGSSNPKGMYDIKLPSGKPLFQLQAERILRLQKIAQDKFPGKNALLKWYVMTSPATHQATTEFFGANNNFGLGQRQVVFFQQATFPCFDLNGKLMMDTKNHINVSPDGNGGIYLALKRSGILDDFEKCGIKGAYVCSVDNVLAKVCDPTFVGYCLERGADCGCKVLPKAYADEKVGVVCLKNKRPAVVEYSDMSPEDTARIDSSTGQLVFNTGNICIHYFSTAFLQRAHSLALPYHVAKKKIDFVDGNGVVQKAADVTGVKMEQFIFDVFPFAENMAVLQGSRDEDFAPVKNAPGSSTDSPDTARAMVSALHKRWAKNAGATFENDSEDLLFEISPLVSYGGEGLDGKFSAPISLPAHISE